MPRTKTFSLLQSEWQWEDSETQETSEDFEEVKNEQRRECLKTTEHEYEHDGRA